MGTTGRIFVVIGGLVGVAAVGGGHAAPPGEGSLPADFTGEIKPVLYVADVEVSAPFYRDVLGFEFLGYSEADGSPYYAEMAAGSQKFGLHDPMNEEQESWVGHQRLYFRVTDVRAHRAAVLARGASPGELVETDWMDMVIVRDPDGHQIVFATTDPSRHSVDPW
ncbi:MAG: VOC family protein [Gemmatimonadota bacterium]|jgi:predicted enzyme related to lactoylglutathione lyase